MGCMIPLQYLGPNTTSFALLASLDLFSINLHLFTFEITFIVNMKYLHFVVNTHFR